MRHRLAAAVILTCLFSLQAQGQQASSSSNQSANGAPPQNTIRPQSKYDPLAGRTHFHGGLWDGVLNGINPSNKDLGQCLSEVRKTAIRSTIENAVFWTAIASLSALFVALFYIYWLISERSRRLDISVTVLTQSVNAYLDARDHALDAIQKYNQLADDYNVLAEKASTNERQKDSNQRRVRRDAMESAASLETSDDSLPAASQGELDSQLAQVTPPPRQETEEKTDRRYANQISALQEKNKTLRSSLNDVLAENDRLKRERTEMRGA